MEHARRNLTLDSNPYTELEDINSENNSICDKGKFLNTRTILIALLFSGINPKINHALVLGFI